MEKFVDLAPPPFITKGAPLENLLPGYELAPAVSGLPPYAVYSKEIIKSPNDDRSYRLVILENGMEVLLISDPTTDKASASIDVRAGHLHDPEDLQGLAHFTEHLLFMGTEKYPGENDYTEYLTQNSGSSNAFTGMDQTCYYFDVHPSALYPALDRFAQFFIAPLFDPSCSEREASAVHSENSKNLQSDMWRMFQLDKSTSSRQHHFWRFGTGNKETLWDAPMKRGEDVRARLMKWQEAHYSANLMKLVVLGKDGLDEMTKEVVEKFSPATNRQLPVPNFAGSPLTEAELQKTILVKSVKDMRHLELTFPFPDENPFFASRPGNYISHLVGHEGPGSVLSYLKKLGWANGIAAGAGNGAAGFEFFKVQLDLTEEGLKHREEVAATIFRYIEIVRTTEPQKWAFDELAQLSDIAFRFKEKSPPTSTAQHLSMQMSKPYPRDQLLSAPYLSNMWRPEVMKAASQLLGPENCRMVVASKAELEGHSYDQKEKWYGTEYTIIPTSDTLLKVPKELPDLHLPKPNTFIPDNLEIFNKHEVDEPAKRPLNLRNTPASRLWYKKDDRWWVPRAGAFFLMRSPLVDDTALHQLQSRFFTELIRDALNEYSYDADLAGLSFNFDSQGDGIVLTLDGYNDKLHLLAEVVFEKMANLKVDPKRFAIIKDQLQRSFVNYRLEQPYQHSAMNAQYLIQETHWTVEQRLAVMDEVTPENMQQYIADFLGRIHVETLIHGNVLKDDAVKLSKLPETTFKSANLTPEELLSHRALLVPEGKHLTQAKGGNPEEKNSAVEQLTYVGDVMDEHLSARLMILAAMVQEPLFDQLRAREQLGYIVSSGVRKAIGFQGLRVIVQSERDAAFVESRIDAFWDDYKTVLEKMSEEEVEKYKNTVINKQLEDHKNMWEESSHLWIHIHAGYYDWEQKYRVVELMRKLTKADLIAFFDTYFFDNPERRIRRLSSYVRSQRLQPDAILALAPALRELNVPVDEAQLKQFAESRPPLEVVKTFSSGFLTQAGKSSDEISSYMAKLETLGVPPPTPEGVTLIEDVEAFRKAAEPGPRAYPAKDYLDLFPAKM